MFTFSRLDQTVTGHLPEVSDEKGDTPVKISFGKDGISIHPEGTGVYDGEFAPILIERWQGKIRLVYWPDINNEQPEIVDMSGALESARTKVKDMYTNGICPDCGEPIPTDAEIGGNCLNCQHVWNPII